jgi:2-polyprenyl-3-methyl-5-hydroxy-6-metoxy-1,4-benzoquinol methylase
MNRPDPTATQAHWDHLAGTYDQAKSRNDVYYGTLKACFDAVVPKVRRANVLEVGCGTGQVLASLNPARGVGIDLSQGMIEQAKSRFALRPELSFQAVDARAAAKMGPFDAVISADVMEHVDDWRGVIDAMLAACSPGGIIAISTPNPRWALPLWILEKLKLKMPEGPHCFVPAAAIAAHLASRGVTITSRRTHLMLPARLGGAGPWLSRRLEPLPLAGSMGVIQMICASTAGTTRN